jgi:hypothetical protein
VLARLPANGTRGGLAAAAALAAAVLVAVLVAGCGAGSPAAAPASPASSAPGAVPARLCTPWTGLNDLDNVTTWLRQMIGDEVIFGPGTAAANRDGKTVISYARSAAGSADQLPARYASALRTTVLAVAASPYQKTPEQLNTAANNAASLASQLSGLCA